MRFLAASEIFSETGLLGAVAAILFTIESWRLLTRRGRHCQTTHRKEIKLLGTNAGLLTVDDFSSYSSAKIIQ
jgi:hypothetical protein